MFQERKRRTGLDPGSLRVTELAGVEKDRVTLIFMAWHGMAWPALTICVLLGWLANCPFYALSTPKRPSDQKVLIEPLPSLGVQDFSPCFLQMEMLRLGEVWRPGRAPSDLIPSIRPPPSGLFVLIRVRLELRRHQRARHTIPRIFQVVARRQPDRLALVDAGSDVCWTFAQLDAYSNAVANLFCQLGFAPGDVVAIFLEGRPEFVGLWLGLAKVGVEAALLNVNLRREPLAFCLGTSGAKALIFGGELAAGEVGCTHHLGSGLPGF